MRILGIDYGKKKIGLALATSKIAEPFMVLRVESFQEGIDRVVDVVEDKEIEKIVIGISEGKMAEETRAFGKRIKEQSEKPIVYQDETLSTQQAQELSIEAGVNRKKRKSLEDAYSAAIILQSYLDK